jgi:septal ring-binding cell division protein DamX
MKQSRQVVLRPLLIGAWSLLLLTAGARAQAVDEIKTAIGKVDQGQVDEVKKSLPDLVTKYQNTPGLMYLQGRLASDGIEAVKFYQAVVDNFPKSEWADDALYRIYQYYYALGLYRTADQKLQLLKKEYPSSPLLGAKAPVPTREEKPVKLAPQEAAVPADTPQVAKAPPVPAGHYTLQTGAFSTMANAEKQKGFFDDLGYTVDITNKIRGGRSLYLVWVGSYGTAEEARAAGREMKAKVKIDAIIVERY